MHHALALAAVRRAARITTRVQERLRSGAREGTSITKDDRTPVTIADWAAQASIYLDLREALGPFRFMAEEEAKDLAAHEELLGEVLALVRAERPAASRADVVESLERADDTGGEGAFWVLDPIDGTKGFLRLEQYAIALAHVREGQVDAAALACPNLPVDAAAPGGPRGIVLVTTPEGAAAEHRLGDTATGAGRLLRRAGDVAPERCAFVESVVSAHSDQATHAAIAERLGITRPPHRLDSQAKFAALARGDAQIYLRLAPRPGYRQKLWDIAAGARIVEAAGGAVTMSDGSPLDLRAGRRLGSGGVIASASPALHEALTAATTSVL